MVSITNGIVHFYFPLFVHLNSIIYIDKETFDKAEDVRTHKATNLGRVREWKNDDKKEVPRAFVFGTAVTKYADPFRQAEYVYGLIESEVQTDGAN